VDDEGEVDERVSVRAGIVVQARAAERANGVSEV
jgi:hypothetical protein